MRDYPQFYACVADDKYDLSYRDPKVYHRFVSKDDHGVPGIKTYKESTTNNRYWATLQGFAFEDILQNILTHEKSDFMRTFNDKNADANIPDDFKLVGRLMVENGIYPGNLKSIEYTTKILNITQAAGSKTPNNKTERQPKTDLAIIAKDADNNTVRIGISQKNSKMPAVPYHNGNPNTLCDAIMSEDREKIRRILEAIAIFGKDDFSNGSFYDLLDRQVSRTQFANNETPSLLSKDIKDSLGENFDNDQIMSDYVIPLFRKNLKAFLTPVISGKGFHNQNGIEVADYTLKRDKNTGQATLKTVNEYIEELENYEGKAPTLYDDYFRLEDKDGNSLPFAISMRSNKKEGHTIRIQLPTLF